MKLERSSKFPWVRISSSPLRYAPKTDITNFTHILGKNFFAQKNYDKPELSQGVDSIMKQRPIRRIIDNLGEEDVQARVEYLVGGTANHLLINKLFYGGRETDYPSQAINFMIRMIEVGQNNPNSAEAIAAAMTKYITMGGIVNEDPKFKQDVSIMAEAISADPILPWETADLGLSQALRLRHFTRQVQVPNSKAADHALDPRLVESFREALKSYPTVGGEFHFPPTDTIDQSLLRRLVILNMSQYHPKSSIPFSKLDDDVPEIRMNPSTYPIATATWQMMSILFPELNRSYFNISFGKRVGEFDWTNAGSGVSLRTLGSLCYAANYKSIFETEYPGSAHFGEIWLGQTEKVKEGIFSLRGNAMEHRGQMNFYTGFGRIYPELAYYLSLGVKEPQIRQLLGQMGDLNPRDAVEQLNEEKIETIFDQINSLIRQDPKLVEDAQLGQTMTAVLTA